jgi:alkyl hydroperoxide reductase subunit F
MPEVTVYSTKNCPYCRMAKALLDRMGVHYRDIDVGLDRDAAEQVVKISGQYGVPLITVDKEVIVGFDAPRLQELFGDGADGEIYDVLIVGAGPAGLTAAVYCARKSLRTAVVTEQIGGQALESWAIENYMGYRMVSGEELMKKFEEQVRSHETVHLELDRITSLVAGNGDFLATTSGGRAFHARAVILAQGKRPRKLGVTGEEKFLGRGLSVCSTCDGPLFRDKTVAVIGGGNSALQTAIEMSGIAREVHLVVRSEVKGDEVYRKQVDEKKNIITHIGWVLTDLVGDNILSGIVIKDPAAGKREQFAVEGVFAEVGWEPNTAVLDGLVALNEKREVTIDINCHSSTPGIFAAGDITSVKGKQIVIAAGEGAKAALEVYEYLMMQG